MNAECRNYYAILKPLPFKDVKTERAYVSIVDGHYKPLFRTPHGTKMFDAWYKREL